MFDFYDEYEFELAKYEQNSHKSSFSRQRENGRNRFSDEMVPDVCGFESEQDWTQDAM